METLQKFKLLYSRAGFGLPYNEIDKFKALPEAIDALFPKAQPGDLEIVTEEDWLQHNHKAMKSIADETEKKEKKKEFRKRTEDLNYLWMQAMVNTSFPLMEKMSLFWHGHFATHIDNPYFDQKLLNIFRKNALGNFGDLLKQVSKSPAMLQYLNNKQNKKSHPNENFAREVMELFTLGRGNYAEDDIKEAARAFTGWSFDDHGNFEFKEKQHDYSEKNFLGKKGNFNGDDILNILLEQKQTATFITRKIYKYLVSDEEINEKRVGLLAKNFHDSNLSIPVLLREIFSADWFYEEATVGAKIKSPVELLVGYQRLVPITFINQHVIIHIQKILGQHLFNAPNVAGWPGGKNWIDSSSLVLRMRLPEALLGSGELNLVAKETLPETNEKNHDNNSNKGEQNFKIGKVQPDWNAYLDYWKKYSESELPLKLSEYLLCTKINPSQLEDIVSFSKRNKKEDFIKTLTIRMMELPEYQLA